MARHTVTSNLSPIQLALLGIAVLLIAGCGTFKAMNPIDPPKVQAQVPLRNEIGGDIREMTPGVYDVHFEAVYNSPGTIVLALPFALPPNKTVAKIQGLISYNGAKECWSQNIVNMVFQDMPELPEWPTAKNPQFPIVAVKAESAGGGSFSTFTTWDIPVPYQSGHGKIFAVNSQTCTGQATVEFDGVMKIE